ncbi:MAG: hypothetical protein BWY77_00666 [bacterium ADurb.Bin431]|nr:MAG: hypothetical protein BWY77_00666 [bacterium ADurb.Bin431]
MADAGVEKVAESDVGEVMVGDIGDIIFPKDGVAGLGIVPLVAAHLDADAETAPGLALLDGDIRIVIADLDARARVVLERGIGLNILEILGVVGDEIGLKVGVLDPATETAVPFAGPLEGGARRGPARCRPGILAVAHRRIFAALIEIAENRIEPPADEAVLGVVHAHAIAGLTEIKLLQIAAAGDFGRIRDGGGSVRHMHPGDDPEGDAVMHAGAGVVIGPFRLVKVGPVGQLGGVLEIEQHAVAVHPALADGGDVAGRIIRTLVFAPLPHQQSRNDNKQ